MLIYYVKFTCILYLDYIYCPHPGFGSVLFNQSKSMIDILKMILLHSCDNNML